MVVRFSGSLAILLSIILGFALCEVLTRAFDLAPLNIRYWTTNIRHERVRHCLPRRSCVTYTLNDQGLRANHNYGTKSPGEIRILLIGNSHVFGWGVGDDETISAKLQNELADKYPGRIEVINFGIPGVNVGQFHRYAVRYASLLQADVVVQALFETRDTYYGYLGPGDMSEAAVRRQTFDAWLPLATRNDPDPEAGARGSIWWHSAFLRFGYRTWLRLARDIDFKSYNADFANFTPAEGPQDAATCEQEKQQTNLCSADFTFPASWGGWRTEAWQRMFDGIRRAGVVKRACNCQISPLYVSNVIRNGPSTVDGSLLTEDMLPQMESQAKVAIDFMADAGAQLGASGIRFLVLLLPVSGQIIPVDSERESIERFHELWDPQLTRSTALTDYLVARCNEVGLSCMDGVTPIRLFAARRASETLFQVDGSHFLPELNQHIASMIAARLERDLREMIANGGTQSGSRLLH